jgi:hypothetical protein
MHTPRLNDAQVAHVRAFLSKWSLERGFEILGSQLGHAVIEAAGQPIRDLGGLRSLAEFELSSLIELSDSQAHSPDLTFLILERASGQPTALPGPLGNELWRFFSNPKLNCGIFARESGEVAITASGVPPPEGYRQLSRPSSDDYRELARQFAQLQAEPISSQLAMALVQADFYNDWIQRLRLLSSSEKSLLPAWEATRAEYVAGRLSDELSKCGMPAARAAELVATARTRKPVRVPILPKAQPSLQPVTAADPARDFRAIMHAAIDLMSIDELRRLPVSAGLIYDASRRAAR